MAVVTTGEELFINASWTSAKKVPAKSPYGVELVWGENAFATLADAIAYADEKSLTMVKYIDGDKTVALSDAAGKVNYISSKEIKGTETIKTSKTGATYTAQSKQSVANKITFDNGTAPETTVAGFKEVTLNGGGADFTVQGGNNTVTHVYAVNSTTKESTIKESGTVSGKADGTLTVNGAKVIAAGGAWAEVTTDDGNKDEITLATDAFKIAMPGDPASIDWEVGSGSVLENLPGYATVSVASGTNAGTITGGNLNFTRATDAVYTSGAVLTSLTKSISAEMKASGKLTVADSTVLIGSFYSTVSVTGASDFEEFSCGNQKMTGKTTYKLATSKKDTTLKKTSEVSMTGASVGTITVEGIGFDDSSERGITGFSKVTVKDSRIGYAVGGETKVVANETLETVTPLTLGGSAKITQSTSNSMSNKLAGTAELTNAQVGSEGLAGFATVTLDNTTVEGDLGGSYYHKDTDSENIKLELTQVGAASATLNKQTYTSSQSYTPNTVLTLKNGAMVMDSAYGIKTLTLGDGCAVQGKVDMRNDNEKLTRNINSNAKTGIYTQEYQYTSKFDAKGTVTATYGTVGNISGAGKVTVTGTKMGGIYSFASNYTFKDTATASKDAIYYNDYDKNYILDDTMALTNSSSWTSSCTAGATVTLSGAVASAVEGAKTLKITGGGITLADGLNNKAAEVFSSSTSAYLSSANYSSWAAGDFTAVSGANVEEFVQGYQNVTMTGGGFDDGWLYGGKVIKDRKNSYTKYAGTSVTKSSLLFFNSSQELTGKATLTNVTGVGSIAGFANVTLDGTNVAEGINGYTTPVTSKYELKQEFASNGNLTKQNLTITSNTGATMTATLKNGAVVSGDINAVKTLNVSSGGSVGGKVRMIESKYTRSNNITSNAKQGYYEGNYKVERNTNAVGTVTATSATVSGAIIGANKVTATDAKLGDLTASSTKIINSYKAQGANLTSGGDERSVDSATATLYLHTGSTVTSAAGQVTLTGNNTAGKITNFATVKLEKGVNTVTAAYAGKSNDVWSYDYKNGELNYKRTSSYDVQGTLTASKAVFTGDNTVIRRFATVTLTDCFMIGTNAKIYGGKGEHVATGSASGATYGEAISAFVSSSWTDTFAAAGKLTATNSYLGAIENYATVTLTNCTTGAITVASSSTAKATLTLAGDNLIDDNVPLYAVEGFATINVKGGTTMVEKGLLSTAGNDSITVAAKAEFAIKQSVLFGEGNDSLTVNGTFRAAGWFEADALEKLSGSGLLALNDVNAKFVLDEIAAGNIKKSGNLEIVAAGTSSDDVLAVRTKKEELADNTADKARAFDLIEMAGWLSGQEVADAGKFADTEDWISFTAWDGVNYRVEMTDVDRHGDLTVELYNSKGDTKLADVDWDAMTERFDVVGVDAGTDYKLRLTVAENKSALSYTFGNGALA